MLPDTVNSSLRKEWTFESPFMEHLTVYSLQRKQWTFESPFMEHLTVYSLQRKQWTFESLFREHLLETRSEKKTLPDTLNSLLSEEWLGVQLRRLIGRHKFDSFQGDSWIVKSVLRRHLKFDSLLGDPWTLNSLLSEEWTFESPFMEHLTFEYLLRKHLLGVQLRRLIGRHKFDSLLGDPWKFDSLLGDPWLDSCLRDSWSVDLDRREPRVIHNADTSEEKMIVEKQEVYLNYQRSCHGTNLLKSFLSLAPFFWPCAGGTGHGSGQPEHQGHSEIYPSTLNVVSNCPSRGEYIQRSLARCADVCGSYMQDGNCAYHCMRDSSKTKLVEFCAKPKPLFDYCPEYDPVDQTIQKDLATLCNSTFSRTYYNSSDIYFCDPDNCLQLHESSVRSGATTLTTLMNETTEMNGGDNQEWFLPLLVVLAALILAIIIGCILRVFVKGGISKARTRKMTKKRNQNEKQYVYGDILISLI